MRTNSTKDGKEEYVVEKIMSKRYNPRRKTFEYLIKWENFPASDNTWEPAAHLDSCKAMLEEFEAQLQKQKLEKAKKAAAEQKEQKKIVKPFIASTSRGRPQRTSKQKALNQVKAWCGDISDTDETAGKRKFSDVDSDSDSFEKKMRLDDNSDSSDDEVKPPKHQVTIRKVGRPPFVNGVGKKPIPEKVLIPDSQGIVRINQKQAAELSSGVYIMSKTAGIIKLDSNTSKLATSGGQTIVKVAPKIGQTQIRVVKKDVPTNITPAKPSPKPKPRVGPKPVAKTPKKEDTPKKTPKTVIVEEKMEDFPSYDDESDGIPELEFPTDLPIPEPSPPREFTLDPETGKVVGEDYPADKEVEIFDEPKLKPYNLENLVKLAAADLLDDEMAQNEEEKDSNKTSDSQPDTTSVNTTAEELLQTLSEDIPDPVS